MHSGKCLKKFILLIIILITLSSCTKIDGNIDTVVDSIMIDNKIKTNTVSTSYELYIPTGVKQSKDNEYNQKLKIKNRYIYLYVDTISYYYKNALNYKTNENYNYYFKELNINNKTGYIGIDKVEDDLYYCEIIYNYSKIEFYSNLEDLPIILANSLIIVKSIKYNDSLISVGLESNIKDGREVKYELDSPKDSKSTFSDFIQEYVPKEEQKVELPNND